MGNPEGLLLCRIEPSVDLWRDAAYSAQPPGMHTLAHPCRQEHALWRRVAGRSGGSFFGEHGISAERVGWEVLGEIRATRQVLSRAAGTMFSNFHFVLRMFSRHSFGRGCSTSLKRRIFCAGAVMHAMRGSFWKYGHAAIFGCGGIVLLSLIVRRSLASSYGGITKKN